MQTRIFIFSFWRALRATQVILSHAHIRPEHGLCVAVRPPSRLHLETRVRQESDGGAGSVLFPTPFVRDSQRPRYAPEVMADDCQCDGLGKLAGPPEQRR